MSLDNLVDFIGDCIVPRDVEHAGKKRTFRILELPSQDAEDLFIGVSQDAKKNKGLRSRIIARGVVNDEGKPAFTFEEAQKLPLWLANALQDHVLEVNGLKGDAEASEADAKKE